MSKQVFTTNSHYACGQWCKRKRWLQYHYQGRGIVPASRDIPLSFGSAVHSGLQSVLIGDPPEKDFTEGLDPMWAWVAECLIYAWARYVSKPLFGRYELVSTEQELVRTLWKSPKQDMDLIRGDKLDAVLRDKQTDELVGLEFKTTGVLDQRYLDNWHYSAQPIAHARAIEHHFGEPCRKVRMEFLYKGKLSSTGVLYSPFGSCFVKQGVLNPVPYQDYNHTKKMKADHYSWALPWEQGMTPGAYVDLVGNAATTLLGSVDVYPSADHIDRWEATMLEEEKNMCLRLHLTKEDETDPKYFPGLFSSSCRSGLYFKRCEYLPICWEHNDPQSLLDSGVFTQRQPHYEYEAEEA